MRIIRTPEENKPKVEWTKQENCSCCNATLEFTNLDIEHRIGKYNEDQTVVTCPYCGNWFEVLV